MYAGGLIVDTELDTSSENPVQNKVVAGAINEINSDLSVQDLTSQLQYRYCRSGDARNRLLRIGNLIIYHVTLVTEAQATNNRLTFVKIPSNLLPASAVMTVGWTNNNDSSYARYNLPFSITSSSTDYNLEVDYTSLGGALSSGSWLWGTVIWTIGH